MDTHSPNNEVMSSQVPLDIDSEGLGRLLTKRASDLVNRLIDSTGRREPPFSVEELAALQGVRKIEKTDLGETGALLLRLPDGYVIKVNANQHPFRQNFSCAHELGHTLLHELERKSTTDSPEFRTLTLNMGRKTKERLCDAFAAELLMPEPIFRKYLLRFGASVDAMEWLSNTFRVSIPAVAIRTAQISEESCVAILWRRCEKARSKGFLLVWSARPGGKLHGTDYHIRERVYVRDPSALLKAYQGYSVTKSFKALELGKVKKRCYMESKGFGHNNTRYVISFVFPER